MKKRTGRSPLDNLTTPEPIALKKPETVQKNFRLNTALNDRVMACVYWNRETFSDFMHRALKKLVQEEEKRNGAPFAPPPQKPK